VYNAQEYLAECLECLLAQELDINEYEIILVNDGSTDNSLSIMNEYSQKYSNIKVFSNCNKGQGYCRNFGIKKSHGEYIYFIDSDDLIERKFLGKLIDIVEIYTLDFLGFGIITNHKYTRYNHPLFHVDTNIAISSYEIKTGIQTVADFSYNNGPWWYIFRKKILVENNFEFEEEHLFEDGLFTTELLICAQRVIILSVKLYYYFKNVESTTTTNNKEKRLKRIEDMYFVIFKFKYLIDLAKSKLANDADIKRLKHRQE
jgi:glycosyltransferase involved in cell wall biosynthesis